MGQFSTKKHEENRRFHRFTITSVVDFHMINGTKAQANLIKSFEQVWQ